jgi:hypothetical protein
MPRLRIALLSLVVLVCVVTPLAHAQTLGAVLTGSQEVPPNTIAGFGNATVDVNRATNEVTVTITVANLGSPINNFHIHEAPPGTNGPVVVDLIGLGGTFVNGTMHGTFAVNPAVAERLLQNPRGFYVNVHTVALPGGAVRGQLSSVSGGAVTYAAELRPGNEVPPVTSTAFGSAFVTFDPINDAISWDVHTVGIGTATMSHIHRGAAGVNGPVIINFATSPAQIPGGHTSGSGPVTAFQSGNLQPQDLDNLATPAGAVGYYVNVHSTAVPSGEVRGQLVPANEYDIPIAGRVTNGIGQSFVTDVRVFNPSYTNAVTALVEYFPSGLSANTTANESLVVNITPRATVVLDDVVHHLNGDGTTGALRVSSATPLAVTSRIYLDRSQDHGGTLGQFVAAQPRANALRRGVIPHLSNSADVHAGFRTNIGFFNPNTSDAVVRLELRDSDGTLLGQRQIVLGALSQQQSSITAYFPGIDIAAAGDVTLSFDAGAPIFAYAAVNDNVSGDSMLIPAQSDSGVAANSSQP